MTNLIEIQNQINQELGNKETFNALVSTTFKGLEVMNVKKAIFEGMVRGFTFRDFLEKNIYAIPFKTGYSLVTSIDYARKIGMRSNIVGKSAPVFKEEEGKIISCSITVKRKVSEEVGEYTATVFFNEYNTGRNLWISKPRTMISKVAEMHALRMACPEELSQAFVEEEVEYEKEKLPFEITGYKEKLGLTKSIEELKSVWSALPIEVKNDKEVLLIKDNLKKQYETN